MAESIEIFCPIIQFGCLQACSTEISDSFSAEVFQRSARSVRINFVMDAYLKISVNHNQKVNIEKSHYVHCQSGVIVNQSS